MNLQSSLVLNCRNLSHTHNPPNTEHVQLRFWAGSGGSKDVPPAHVVVYSGCPAARLLLLEHDVWLSGNGSGAGDSCRVPRADVVLTSFDAAVADGNALTQVWINKLEAH